MKKLVAESLHEYRDLVKEQEEINEGLFGPSDKEKAAIAEVAAKTQLTDEEAKKFATDKFAKDVLIKVFKMMPAIDNVEQISKRRNEIIANPTAAKEEILNAFKGANALVQKGKGKIETYLKGGKLGYKGVQTQKAIF